MSDAKIHDLGYSPYDGPRQGLHHAMLSLGVHAAQRVLGLKRTARHKVLPALVIVIAFVPAIIYMGLAAVLPTSLLEEDVLPSYGEYYGLITFSMYLFASFVAPEALCTDRRTGMLALYLASPLDRTTYVIAKVGAVTTVLLSITFLPQLFLLIAYTLEGAGPDGGFEFVETLGRLAVAGVTVALFFATLSSCVSSFTSRRGIASAAIVMIILVAAILSSSLLEATDVGDELGLLNLGEVAVRSAVFVLGEAPDWDDRGLSRLDGSLALAATAAFSTVFAAINWQRYKTVKVDR